MITCRRLELPALTFSPREQKQKFGVKMEKRAKTNGTSCLRKHSFDLSAGAFSPREKPRVQVVCSLCIPHKMSPPLCDTTRREGGGGHQQHCTGLRLFHRASTLMTPHVCCFTTYCMLLCSHLQTHVATLTSIGLSWDCVGLKYQKY